MMFAQQLQRVCQLSSALATSSVAVRTPRLFCWEATRRLQQAVLCASSGEHAQAEAAAPGLPPSQGPQPGSPEIPWAFQFQLNERFLQWDDSATVQLIKLHVAQKLDKDVPWVEGKLSELAVLLPDIVSKLEHMRADIVLQMVQDTEALALKLVALRGLLPNVNLSSVFARHPTLLLEMSEGQVAEQVEALSAALPGVDVGALVDREPLLLRADIGRVLDDVRRLLPDSDAVAVLLRDPSIVLDMETSGMPTSNV